jgi:1,4-alpha-glucan branching enzyme
MSEMARDKEDHSTRFVCHAPEAKAVFLAGTFNGWHPLATPLVKDAQGNWSTTLSLWPGRYEYKFVVDGAWSCGPGHDGDHQGCRECVPNPFGTTNRIIEVT